MSLNATNVQGMPAGFAAFHVYGHSALSVCGIE